MAVALHWRISRAEAMALDLEELTMRAAMIQHEAKERDWRFGHICAALFQAKGAQAHPADFFPWLEAADAGVAGTEADFERQAQRVFGGKS